MRGRLGSTSTLRLPLAGVLMLFLPMPLFASQSFMQLGDLTLASGALAFATGALPCAIGYGLLRLPGSKRTITHPARDWAALLAAAQWLIVLAVWGMIPFVSWQ